MAECVNTADNNPQFSLVDLDDVTSIEIGSPAAVGTTGEFAAIVGDTFEQGGNSNDLGFLLDELVGGDGVDGVTLIDVDNDSVTLGLTNAAGVTDIVAVDNATVIEDVAQGFVNTGNDRPQFSLVDLSDTTSIITGATATVGTTGEFAAIVGDTFEQGGNSNDLGFLLDELILGDGVDGVSLNTLDNDSVTLGLSNAAGVTDLVAIDNAGIIAELASSFVNTADGRAQFALFDLAENDTLFTGDTMTVGTTGEFGAIAGETFTPYDLPELFGEVLAGDGVDGVTLITVDDDSVTLGLTNAGGVTDTVVFDNVGDTLTGIC